MSLGLAPNARHSALLVIIISDICGLTLRLSLTRRSGARGDPNRPGRTLRFWWSVRSPLHVSLPPTPPPPLLLCHGYMQMKREFPKGVENPRAGAGAPFRQSHSSAIEMLPSSASAYV